MAKILFDEKFYYCDNLDYFEDAIKFVKTYFDVKTLLLCYECQENSTFNNMRIIIDSLISDIDDIEIIMVDNFSSCEYDDLMVLNIDTQYLKIIKHYSQLNEDIIFISIENLDAFALKRIGNVYIINHVYKEIDSCFSDFVSENRYVKNIIKPTKNKPLPNSDLCQLYKQRQNDLMPKKNKDELQALYYSVGKEVIKRNGYKTNQHVSSLNPSVFGGIFSYDTSKTIYSSVDIEKGAIEIFNYRGKHQDEYTYTGEPRDKQDNKKHHDIKV